MSISGLDRRLSISSLLVITFSIIALPIKSLSISSLSISRLSFVILTNTILTFPPPPSIFQQHPQSSHPDDTTCKVTTSAEEPPGPETDGLGPRGESNKPPFAPGDSISYRSQRKKKRRQKNQWENGVINTVRSDKLLDIRNDSDGCKVKGVSRSNVKIRDQQDQAYRVSKPIYILCAFFSHY
jgi:hypothetical protein